MAKTKIALLLIAVAFLFINSSKAMGQTVKRIQVAKGTSSATVSGSTGSYGVTYMVRARSGQKIVVDLDPAKSVGIKIETDGSNGHEVLLREERGGHYETGLEESGDYTIFVGSTTGRPVSFRLTVKITKLADI